MKSYKLFMHYPDSHSEEIDEVFSSLEAAKAYGKDMLVQIDYTEAFHDTVDDLISSKARKKPFYEIMEIEGGEKKLIFKSKK